MKNLKFYTLVYVVFLCVTFFNSSQVVAQCNVKLPKDFIECNNSAVSIQSNTDYAPIYSSDDPSDKYFWTITGGPFTYFGGTNRVDRYPKVNLQDGYIYQIVVRFTNSSGVCSDTQIVYRNVGLTAEINNPVQPDTTVCQSSQTFSLVASVEGPYTSFSWSSTGTGTFTNSNTFSPTYTLSQADKDNGRVQIIFNALANVNGSCFPNDTDTLTINILKLLGKDSSASVCSNNKLNYQPVVNGANQFTWTSQVVSGNVGGNSVSGTGKITDSLINNSTSTDAVVRYTITPIYQQCSGAPFSYLVTIKPKPSIIASNTLNLCTGSASNIQLASSVSNTLYTWTSTVITGSVSGNSNSNTPVSITSINDVLVNNSPSNTASVKYTITPYHPFGCIGQSVDALIALAPQVTQADAGPSRIICLKDTIHLNGNSPTSGSGTWSQLSGPGTSSVGQPNNPSSSVTNLQPGTYNFIWTISNGVCAPTKDTVTINISSPVVAGMLPPTADGCTGSNSGNFTLTNFNGNISRWEYSINAGQTWVNINNTTNVQTYSNLTATTWYRAIVESGACGSVITDTAVVTIYTLVTSANAGSDRTLCLKDSIHLNANAPTSGTGSWNQLNGSNTALINQQANPTTSVTNLQPGIYTFIWSISNGVCPASTDTVRINISIPTIPGKLSGSATVCTGNNSGTMTLNSYSGSIINWEYSNNAGQSWIALSNTSAIQSYSNLTTTTWYRTTVQNGACISAFSDTAVIAVVPTVTPANAGQDRIICLQDSIHLSANASTSGSGTWSQLSGPTTASISQQTNPATSVTNLQPGTYRFVWTISNAVCPSSSDTVTINISTPTFPGTLTGNATVCINSNGGAIVLNNHFGNVINWEFSNNNGQSWTNIINTTNTHNYSNLTSTTWYRVSVKSGACAAAFSDTTIVTVMPLVTPANAGSDRTICLQDSIHLSANAPTSGSGTWSQLSGPNTVLINQQTNPATSVTNLQPGTYRFVWTVGNAVCPSSSDTVTINISTPTIPGTLIGSSTVCTNSNGGTIVLNNYTGNVINWESSNNGAQSWTGIANTTNIHSYTNLTSTTWFRVTVKSGACAAAFSDTAIVTVMPVVTPANAGVDKVVCLSDSISLNGNTPTSGIGTWSQLSGPTTVIINDANNPATSVTNVQPGSYRFIWMIGNGICPSSMDTVTVNISSPVVAGMLPPTADGCIGSNSGSFTLTNFSGNVNRWEYSTNGGQSWSNISNTSSVQNYSNLNTTTWYRAVVESGACGSVITDTAVVTIYPLVTPANSGADTTICLQQSINLYGNAPVNGTGSWSQLSGPNTVAINQPSNPATSVTNLQPGTYRFIWTISNSVCASSSDTVTINISAPTLPGTLTGNATVCTNSNGGTIVLNNYFGNVINWEFSTNGGQSWTNIINTTNTYSYSNLTSTTWYRVSVKSGACAAAFSDTAIVTVVNTVTPANAGADKNICLQYSINLNGNTPTSGTGTWSQISGPNTSTISEPSNPSTLVTNLRPGTYSFVWGISNGVCLSSYDTVQIFISSLIINSIDTTTKTVCYGSSVTINSLQASGGNGTYQYQWERSYDGNNWTLIAGATQASYTFTADTTVYLRRYISSPPCSSVSDFIKILVQQSISGNAIQANQNICYGDSAASIEGSLPAGGNGLYTYTWQRSIDGGNTWTNIVNSNSKDFSPGIILQSTIYRRLVESGACSGSFSSTSNQVIITVNPLAKASFTVTTSLTCAPFKIDSTNIKVERHNDLNKAYFWYVNNNLLGTGAAFPGYILNRPDDSVTIKLRVTSLFNCKDDSSQYVMRLIPLPKPAFTVTDTIGCGPLTISFTNQSALTSQYSYLWDFGNGQTSSNQQPGSITFLPSSIKTDTTYLVRLTAFNNCDTVLVTKLITVRSKPKASFIDVPASGCSPLNANFYVTINSTASVHRLYFGDGTDTLLTASTQFSHLYKSTVTTTYYAKLISSNECGIDSFIATVKSLNIDADLKFDLIDSAGCAPHNVSIVNRSTGTVNYTWNMGDGTPASGAAVTDTIKHLYTLPGAYPVTLTAKHQCGDTTLVRYVYVHEVPKAAFSVFSGSTCIGDSLRFTNNSSAATDYTWNFGDGRSSSSYNVSHSYAAASRYNISLTSNRRYATGVTCSDVASNAVTIVDHLPGNMYVSDSTGTCLPFTVTFINRNQPSALTTWKFGDGNTATGDTVVHTYTTGGAFTATVTAESAGGCVYTDTTIIDIKPTDGTLVYTAANYCGNNNTRFVAKVQNTDSLIWHFGDGTVVHTTDTVVYHSYAPGTYLPWVELIGKEGCRKPIKGIDSIRAEKLQPGFTWNTTNNCGNSNVGFSDTSRSFFGVQQWQWSFGDGAVGTGKNVQHQYNNAGIYQVRLIITSPLGCKDTITKPVNVVVYNRPSVTIQTNSNGCVSTPHQFTTNVQSADSVSTYSWNMGNGQTQQGKSVTAVYTNAGTYNISLITRTINGCYDTTSTAITVHPAPQLVANKQLQICRGQQIVLRASNATSVTWSNDQQTICSNCTQTTVSPLTTTKYYVSGANQYGCTSRDTVVVNVIQSFNMRISGVDTLCVGEQTQIFSSGATTCTWFPAEGLSKTDVANPFAKPSVTTTYTVIGHDASNCFSDTANVQIVVGAPTQVHLGADTIVIGGSSIVLGSRLTNGIATQYKWSSAAQLNCSNCPEPVATIRRDECFTSTVTNQYGCVTSDTICIKTFCKDAQVFIPNAFSPDADGVNDLFYVMGSGIKVVKSFMIFTRWGELIFQKENFQVNDVSKGWDGTIRGQKAPPDVFVYICNVLCENGVPYSYKGNVAIIK